jgi:ATP-binding cassette subfamily B protein
MQTHRTMMGFRRDQSALRGKRIERQLLLRVAAMAKPYRLLIVGFLVAVIADNFLGIVPALLFRTLLDDLTKFTGSHLTGSALSDLKTSTAHSIFVLTLILVAVAVGDALLTLAQRWFSARIGEGLIYEMRVRLFDHVQRMPISFFTRTQTGALNSRLNNDVIGAQQAVTNTLGTVVSNFINIVITLIVMLQLEWRLTLLTLVVLPFFILPARRIGRHLQVITREGFQLNASMNNTIIERFNVAGALVVKLFGKHDRESEQFSERAGRVRDIGVQSAMYSTVLVVALTFVAAVGTAIVYFVGGNLVLSSDISIGTLGAFVILIARIYQPLTQLTNARVDVLTALVSFERVFEVLDFEPLIEDRPGATELVEPKGRIELEHVWFHHPPASSASIPSLVEHLDEVDEKDDAWTLRDVSLLVEPGEMVALVGPSGAGKTTTAMLVPRIADTVEGSVRIDGRDVRDLTLESVRSAVGFVMQDPHLFHETIRENLLYARPGASDEQLIDACRAARIHDLIASLPSGYDTVVGERGYRMSGGEKQRLAIARVLLKEPAIVILDEATSHLDTESEIAIQRALDAALTGRTALVIAHRLSTIVNADRIIVLNEGRVVEQGTHTELLDAEGLYADLYRTQQDARESADVPPPVPITRERESRVAGVTGEGSG